MKCPLCDRVMAPYPDDVAAGITICSYCFLQHYDETHNELLIRIHNIENDKVSQHKHLLPALQQLSKYNICQPVRYWFYYKDKGNSLIFEEDQIYRLKAFL